MVTPAILESCNAKTSSPLWLRWHLRS